MNDDEDPALSRVLREHGTRHVPPEDLKARIRMQVALAAAAQANGREDRHRKPGWRDRLWRIPAKRWAPPLGAFAAGVLCMALLQPLLQSALQRVGPGEPVEVALLENHVRALKAATLVQVVSTDRHTVKPWFQGRLDYAPPVRDLAAEGFPLMGGRVATVRGEPTAALVYTRRQHVIDLFVLPQAGAEAPAVELRRGFTLARWSDGSMTYWAVSDADPGEIDAFVSAWKAYDRAR